MKKMLLVVSIVLGIAAPASAQEDAAAFFKGKTLRLIVGIGVGSGYDINARLLARFMVNHIPGQPIIIVQNQPGAGSLAMTNALYNTGPFDGTVMGASFNGMPTTPLLQPGGARFGSKARRQRWAGPLSGCGATQTCWLNWSERSMRVAATSVGPQFWSYCGRAP